MKTKLKLTAVFEETEEGGYIAFIEEIPGVNTQGETLEESKANLLDLEIPVPSSAYTKASADRQQFNNIAACAVGSI